VESELYLALDAGCFTRQELTLAHELAVDAKKWIQGMISYPEKN
jgi:hypothetical protein